MNMKLEQGPNLHWFDRHVVVGSTTNDRCRHWVGHRNEIWLLVPYATALPRCHRNTIQAFNQEQLDVWLRGSNMFTNVFIKFIAAY